LQVTPASAKTKSCKRACLPQRTADRKDAAKMKENYRENEQRNANKGCNQFGLNGLGKRVGSQGAS